MSEWQPIETIPETGEEVLIAMQGGTMAIAPAVRWMPSRQERLKFYKATGEWPNAAFMPTHWMPLAYRTAYAEADAVLIRIAPHLPPLPPLLTLLRKHQPSLPNFNQNHRGNRGQQQISLVLHQH